jgi:SAM-dependent methyltransferase
VSAFSQQLIERSGYEGEEFTAVYDAYRPRPPDELLDILCLVAQVDRPRGVVDVGAGTGLSTRAWADRAEEVVGVEANPDMVERARHATTAANVRFVEAFADATGLAAASADIVTCAQAFHWMEPAPALAEAARILRPGGVFAAYDYDVPPVVQPEVDAAFADHFAARREARKRLGLEAGGTLWTKDRHVERIRESRRFRTARELVCHGWGETDATALTGLAESLGGPRVIFGDAAPEVHETFERLREVAQRVLGDVRRPLLVCYRIRLGIR